MEPLSIAASAVAFGQATKQLVKFARFAKSLGDIPDDYRDFVKELKDTSELAQEVDELVKEYGGLDGQSLNVVKEDLEHIVQSLRQLSEDVRRSPKRKSSETIGNLDKISTIRWEKKKTDIAKLREYMRRTRHNLSLHLQIFAFKKTSVRAQKKAGSTANSP